MKSEAEVLWLHQPLHLASLSGCGQECLGPPVPPPLSWLANAPLFWHQLCKFAVWHKVFYNIMDPSAGTVVGSSGKPILDDSSLQCSVIGQRSLPHDVGLADRGLVQVEVAMWGFVGCQFFQISLPSRSYIILQQDLPLYIFGLRILCGVGNLYQVYSSATCWWTTSLVTM